MPINHALNPPDLAEYLTIARLLESLASTTCPACGNFKNARMTFCGRCFRMLSRRLKSEVYRGIDNGYDRAVAESMKYLKRPRFIMPGEDPLQIGQAPLSVAAVRPLIFRSCRLAVCPKCAAAKRPSYPLCGECRIKLRVVLEELRAEQAQQPSLIAEPIDVALNRTLLNSDPDRFTANIIQAIQLIKGKVFHYPKE